jgi:hypothetical protein
MKRIIFIVAVLAFVAGLVVFATDASAGKYNKMREQTWQTPGTDTGSDLYSSEQNRSMTDCMEYSANFRSGGKAKDMAAFNKQYGAPQSERGGKCTYNYDNYTNIMLDCSRGRCYSKCMSK